MMAGPNKPVQEKNSTQQGQAPHPGPGIHQGRVAQPPAKQRAKVSSSGSTSSDFIELGPAFPRTGLGLLEDFFTWRNEARGLGVLEDFLLQAGQEDWSGDSSLWPQEKKLRSLDPELRPKVEHILEALRAGGFQPKIFFGWRSVAVQEELFKKGNTKVHFSFHNSQKPDGTPDAHAADIVDERWGWDAPAAKNGFWAALGKAAKDEGLVWGGDWTTFTDVAHVQNRENNELAAVKRESGL